MIDRITHCEWWCVSKEIIWHSFLSLCAVACSMCMFSCFSYTSHCAKFRHGNEMCHHANNAAFLYRIYCDNFSKLSRDVVDKKQEMHSLLVFISIWIVWLMRKINQRHGIELVSEKSIYHERQNWHHSRKHIWNSIQPFSEARYDDHCRRKWLISSK